MSLARTSWAIAPLLTAFLFAAPHAAMGQGAATFPSKPVRLVVAYAPGGPTDVVTRLVGAFLQKKWNQPFVVENRPGANTQIATTAVVQSPADGHTLLMTSDTVASNQVVDPNWPYKVAKDLTPVGLLAGTGYTIIVTNGIPVKTMKELVDYIKANPGKVNEAMGGTVHLPMLDLERRLGLKDITAVIYKGNPEATNAVMSGEAHYYAPGSPVTVVKLAEAGKLKIVAYTDKERHRMMPTVPTVAESGVGLPDFSSTVWFALMGPASVPQDIVAKLNGGIQEALKDPEVSQKIESFGLRPLLSSVAETQQQVSRTLKTIEELAASGVKVR